MNMPFQGVDFAPFFRDQVPACLVRKRLGHSVVFRALFDLTILQAWLFAAAYIGRGRKHER
jgi:hypothetical protein